RLGHLFVAAGQPLRGLRLGLGQLLGGLGALALVELVVSRERVGVRLPFGVERRREALLIRGRQLVNETVTGELVERAGQGADRLAQVWLAAPSGSVQFLHPLDEEVPTDGQPQRDQEEFGRGGVPVRRPVRAAQQEQRQRRQDQRQSKEQGEP